MTIKNYFLHTKKAEKYDVLKKSVFEEEEEEEEGEGEY